MRSFWSLSTNDHFHPAYYTIYMHKWMGSSENGNGTTIHRHTYEKTPINNVLVLNKEGTT
ncbi:hypothetical protein T08_2318 [Trichinella sp. T8]|nr:hypothetical protein T08_2318 [Trichinella sp. T8]